MCTPEPWRCRWSTRSMKSASSSLCVSQRTTRSSPQPSKRGSGEGRLRPVEEVDAAAEHLYGQSGYCYKMLIIMWLVLCVSQLVCNVTHTTHTYAHTFPPVMLRDGLHTCTTNLRLHERMGSSHTHTHTHTHTMHTHTLRMALCWTDCCCGRATWTSTSLEWRTV